jgi:hypothetical protein
MYLTMFEAVRQGLLTAAAYQHGTDLSSSPVNFTGVDMSQPPREHWYQPSQTAALDSGGTVTRGNV